ncbi:hypothetical protein FRC09_003834 [Ceratobasidium sp. 395]|nr:hypothetical protein FRC09_003834 [Ceratobasidium sp. 395]
MSLRTTLSHTTTKCPKLHTLLAIRFPTSSRSSPSYFSPTTASGHQQPTRSFTSTSNVGRGKTRSLIGRFFGARDPPPVYRNPAQVVRDAVETLCVLLRTNPPVRPALLHKPYAELVTAVPAYRASKPKDPLDLTLVAEDQETSQVDIATVHEVAGDSATPSNPLWYLSELLSALTTSPRGSYPHPAELELAVRVHADMTRVFVRKPSWEDTLCVVHAYALLRRPNDALGLASTMEPPPPGDAWAPIACAFALSSPSTAGDELRVMMRTMAARGIEPPPGAWVALVSSVRPEEVGPVLKALPEGVRGQVEIWATALEVLGKRKEGEEVAKEVRKRVGVNTRAWAALVVQAGLKEGHKGAERIVKEFEEAGGIPDTLILRALVGALPHAGRTPRSLRRLEDELGVAADEDAWGVLIDASTGGVADVWEAARESGINLTSRTLDRVVGREDVPVVERLRVYRDVNATWPVGREAKREGEEEGEINAWMRREDAWSTPGPTTGTYTALLTGLASGRGSGLDKATASVAAVELLTDMRQRGITFSHVAQSQPSRTSRSSVSPLIALTILLMQDAPSHEAAFKMYAYAHVVDPKSGAFGEKEYKQVLRAFAELRVVRREEDIWKDGGRHDGWVDRAIAPTKRTEVYAPPPAALYYEIMRDMQRGGYEVGASEYTVILKAYAAVSIPSEPDPHLASAHNTHVLEHIQRIHTLLKLDTNLTPDTVLLNALMNAYGHAGSLDGALAIWDQMKRPSGSGGGWDNASVSIIVDALGWAGRSALPRARQLWDGLRRRHGARLNTNNYTSWVEALCRMGEFEEAERVVYVDMREGGNPRIRPDEKTLRTLVSFAWRVGRQVQVLEDVRREFPGVV